MNPPPPAEGLASRLFLGPALRTQPDRRLVTLVRDGYDAAFEEIVRRYGRQLGRYATAIVGGRSEDVTQDAFSKALLALGRDSETEIDLKPWLYRIVRNTALNDLRDRPPDTAELIEALGSGSRSAAEEAERREEMAELIERLRALPEPQRAAIVMRELEGLGHEEIAAALGLSDGAARQAIFRARQALRNGLGLMIPLPILRLLIEPGADAGVAAAGAGGAAVAAGGTGAGAGAALKLGVATAVLAGSVGTGIAINEDRSQDHRAEIAAAATLPASGAAVSRRTKGGGERTGGGSASHGEASGEPGGGGDAGIERSSAALVTSGGDEGRGPGPSGSGGGGRHGVRHGPPRPGRQPGGEGPDGPRHHLPSGGGRDGPGDYTVPIREGEGSRGPGPGPGSGDVTDTPLRDEPLPESDTEEGTFGDGSRGPGRSGPLTGGGEEGP
jgi:RNA polymerase sigma factor (sigma-70 family)